MEKAFDLPALFKTIRFALEYPNIITGGNVPSIKVKQLRLENSSTLLCEYHSLYDNSLDVKTEMALIFGCYNGFFRDGDFNGWNFESFAASALNPNEEEIMFCISSQRAAEMIGTGNSIGWLTNSYFQENKRIIGLQGQKGILLILNRAFRWRSKIRF